MNKLKTLIDELGQAALDGDSATVEKVAFDLLMHRMAAYIANKILREVLANLHNTGVEHFNGIYDDIEDLATVKSNLNDALISAVKILEQTK